ncbi:MAG TPA: hypothetical protein VKR80_02340 [Candidatus Limnocylindria bacterium]|nr:hypothetical protein [Candidatus Limnocylindria bacterium]
MLVFLLWLLLGTISGATALVLFLDWILALADPDPSLHEGYGLQVTIAVVAAWIFAYALHRIGRHLREHGI